MPFEPGSLREALTVLGEILNDRGLAHDIVVVGGGALLLSGHIDRPTKDLDVVARVENDKWTLAEPIAADHWPLRGKHLQDLQALTPTVVELVDAARWCRTHDPSVGFRDVQLGPVLGLFDV